MATSKEKCCSKEIFTRVFVLRSLVAISFVVAAALVGVFNYSMQSKNESNFATSQYNSVSAHAIQSMRGRFTRMNQGTRSMAKLYRHAFPNITSWPEVALAGFFDIAPEMQELSSLQNIVFSPLVEISKQASFENFMYTFFASEPSYPPFAGYTPAGPGIWALDQSKANLLEMFYHDTTGNVYTYNTSYNSSFLQPPFQMSLLDASTIPTLAYNAHSNAVFGPQTDTILNCVKNSPDASYARENCTYLADVQPVFGELSILADPSTELQAVLSFIHQPIVLEEDTADGVKSKTVGFVGGSVQWATLLDDSVPSYVNAIDVVITTSTTSFTFRMSHGEPKLIGLGDHHDTHYDNYARSIDLIEGMRLFTDTTYSLTMYPRKEFFDKYTTDAPRDTSIGYVCIFVFCSVVFVFYDWAVRSESDRKELVLDTKRRFVRFISHEMRTPMNTVHLGLKLFQIELEDLLNVVANTSPEKLAAVIKGAVAGWMMLVDDIMGNSESAVDVLNDLLNYDKIEMGTLRLEFSTVPIFNLVKKTTKAFMMQAKQKDVDLQLVGDYWITNDDGELELLSQYEGLSVVGDATRIAQVLRNLLSNALKFTPTHGTIIASAVHVSDGLPDATVVVPADQQGLLQDARCGSVKIFITDSGAGLSEEQLAHICTEGMQFNANQLQAGGGSGLGLYISKGLAEQHGGTLTASSEGLGKGATFTLELPVRRTNKCLPCPNSNLSSRSVAVSVTTTHEDGAVPVLMSETEPAPAQEPEPVRQMNVLVVDDATSNRKLLMRILSSKGYHCYGAEDGEQGVQAFINLQAENIVLDAVVMDFEMPVMNGPTATKKLRELGCTCFIAGVTGNVLPADVDYFKAHGANTVIAKPLNVDVFESYLAAHQQSMLRSKGDLSLEIPGNTPGEANTMTSRGSPKVAPLSPGRGKAATTTGGADSPGRGTATTTGGADSPNRVTTAAIVGPDNV